MLRRNTRLRREYLYRKSLEGKEREHYEKKRRIREAIQEGRPIPTELRNEESALRREIDLEDDSTAVPRSLIDDEYANATDRDPKILLTTSRNPSAPLTQFVKELKIVFPNSTRMNRGGQVISEIVESCRAHEFSDLVLVHEHRGQPDGLIVCHLPFGPTVYFGLLNVVTRHDIKDRKAMGTMSEAYPHLILDNFSSKVNKAILNETKLARCVTCRKFWGCNDGFLVNLRFVYYEDNPSIQIKKLSAPLCTTVFFQHELGQRTATIMKHLFPVPKPDTKRIITLANREDYISFRHHVYERQGGPKSIDLKEVGPRFELRLYQIKLGTVDQTEAQNEWVLRPYMNTTKKRQFLGD